MKSAWLRKLWAVRAALHLFAVGVVLALPLMGQAGGTTLNVVSIAGGSPTLLGEFAVTAFRQGVVPRVIEDSPFDISGYRTSDVTDDGVLVVTNVIVRDPSTPNPPAAPLETVATAMIRWHRQDDNNINVIILLSSDSGNGVRYVANSARITDFPTMGSGMSVWQQRLTSDPPTFGPPSGDGRIVMDALLNQDPDVGIVFLAPDRGYDGSQLPVETGYSDVAADTMVRYGNFPNVNVPGLQGIVSPPDHGPVQTLLLLYNPRMVYGFLGTDQIIIPRFQRSPMNGIQDLLNVSRGSGRIRWSDIDITLQTTTVVPARLNNPFAARLTEYVNIQRNLSGNPPFVVDDTPINPDQPSDLLDLVDFIPASFGYAFISGVTGNRHANLRVARYRDGDGRVSRPYPITNGAGQDCALPNNVNQEPYSDDPNVLYQTFVVDGSYPLWAYTHVFSRPEDQYQLGAAAQADIFAALTVPSAPDFVHKEGLLRPNELLVERNFFTSDITGEIVTDGQRVVPLHKAVEFPPPPDDDPNP